MSHYPSALPQNAFRGTGLPLFSKSLALAAVCRPPTHVSRGAEYASGRVMFVALPRGVVHARRSEIGGRTTILRFTTSGRPSCSRVTDKKTSSQATKCAHEVRAERTARTCPWVAPHCGTPRTRLLRFHDTDYQGTQLGEMHVRSHQATSNGW